MDNLSCEKRSKIMRAIKNRDTGPELIVRKLAYRLGYRYRLTDHSLPGSPDLVFKRRRKVIFVHGCFWHVHPDCHISHIPKDEHWRLKLAANQERDRRVIELLEERGWSAHVVWECETVDLEKLSSRLRRFLG
jgi:DNA mismatch endonuclease (patch repair protein)